MITFKPSHSLATQVPAFATALEDLESQLSGQLIRPGDADYEQARRLWNGQINKYPALIARCRTAGDIVTAVNFARNHNLALAVRGGAHNSNGFATNSNGLVIDLSPMKGITIDPFTRVARAEPGLTFGELSHAAQNYGLATTTGICSGTGISGATLGGGTGWLMGKYGLAIDNVLSFELVTAEGQMLKASATENPDLFWALRGGGGNFGIVTIIEYQLHPLGHILAGMIIHPMADAKQALRFYRDFSGTAPDDITAYAFLVTMPEIGPAIIFMAGYFGDDMAEGERLLAPLRQFGTPLVDSVQPMAYSDFLAMLDPIAPDGRNYYEPAYSVKQFSDDALDTLIAWAGRMTSPFSAVLIHHIHGAATRVAPDATAFSLREPHYAVVHAAAWEDGPAEPHSAWARDSFAAMQPFTMSGVYIGFLVGQKEEAVRASYRANYERLAIIKDQYDPTNFFCANQNIKPAVR
jgi:hypothetical protein